MNAAVEYDLINLEYGECQSYGRLTVLPLLRRECTGPEYVTMGEALERELLLVTEVSESGSVPELLVKNEASVNVLIIDGEELRGSKQNRVANTTVLLAPNSKTVLPVSCTERGRWSYASPKFSDSDLVMARTARNRKSQSVHASLKGDRGFRSDQSGVWEEVSALQDNLQMHSPTDAMADVYDRVKADLDGAIAAFPRVENQVGLLVFLAGKPVGLDLVSRSAAYAKLHGRLLKSYVVDTLSRVKGDSSSISEESAKTLISELSHFEESTYPSVALGQDYRYERNDACGSALVHEGACIHAAFFWAVENDGAVHLNDMSRSGIRRQWRQGR